MTTTRLHAPPPGRQSLFLPAAIALVLFLTSATFSCKTFRQAGGSPGRQEIWQELGIELISIPGGTFSMGQGLGEACEKPVHEVSVGNFYLAKTEITLGQFGRFVEATGYVTDAERTGESQFWTGTKWERVPGSSWKTLLSTESADNPAGCISWNDAAAFCEWAGLRLPTEAEWEYAASAGTRHTTWAGTDKDYDLAEYAWFRENSGRQAHPVGTRKPNGFGLFDMSGNVREWCADWYCADYYADSAPIDPEGPEDGRVKVARGGSAYTDVTRCRISHRGRYLPDFAHGSVGFRPALDGDHTL